MKVPIPVGITVYLLTWGLGHLRCLVLHRGTLFFFTGFIDADEIMMAFKKLGVSIDPAEANKLLKR